MYRDAVRYGIEWKSQPPYDVLFTPWLSFSDILRLKMIEETVEIYYNSHQFGKTLERLIPRFSSAFSFFGQLASYYEKRQEGGKSSRVRKYEILLEFASACFPEEKDRYRKLLTVDYYLRERAKARPPFAPDQSPYGETLKQIRRQVPKEAHVEALAGEDGSPLYLVFDYEKRNPLTRDACVWQWKEEQKR